MAIGLIQERNTEDEAIESVIFLKQQQDLYKYFKKSGDGASASSNNDGYEVLEEVN